MYSAHQHLLKQNKLYNHLDIVPFYTYQSVQHFCRFGASSKNPWPPVNQRHVEPKYGTRHFKRFAYAILVSRPPPEGRWIFRGIYEHPTDVTHRSVLLSFLEWREVVDSSEPTRPDILLFRITQCSYVHINLLTSLLKLTGSE